VLLCCLCICLQRLHAVKGLSEAKADKMVEAAKKLTNVGSWITGMEAMQKVCAGAGHKVACAQYWTSAELCYSSMPDGLLCRSP
jgi:hypothetical protein